jgi:glycosyltransferase involved in cell wall biosynthesis
MQSAALAPPLSGTNYRLDANSAAGEPAWRVPELARVDTKFDVSDRPVMFAYWGRRGALSQLSLDLARVAATRNEIRCTVSVSRRNEQFNKFCFLRDDLFAIDTCHRRLQAFLYYGYVRNLRNGLKQRLLRDNTRAVVSLMPHLWSPLVAPVIRRAGVRHVAVVHDVDSHTGDRYGLINRWLLREAAAADHVITLSEAVACRLVAAGKIREKKITVLFHPDLNYGARVGPGENQGGPLRVLFLGRILPYKGLDLFVNAIARLRSDGVRLNVGVVGDGKIDPVIRAKLSALGAEIENRWIRHDEFNGILSRYDVVAASHTEASQSGVIAAAFGAGLPVVATPVGGLVEQVIHNVTGLIADAATAPAFAEAIRMLAENPAFVARLRRGIAARREERSIERFFDDMCDISLRGKC